MPTFAGEALTSHTASMTTVAMPTAGGVDRPIKVFFIATGIGHIRRGIETFFRECFDAMHGYPRLDARLFKGSGPDSPGEQRLWCLSRSGTAARAIGKVIRRTPYVVEQLTFLPGLIRRIRRERPDIIFYSDINLAMRLHKYRRQIGVPYRLMYSNGAPVQPPFTGIEHVQQVTPAYYQEAIDFGEPPNKHTLVPYGIHVPTGDPMLDQAARAALRRKLDLPAERPIVLSVGWIAKQLKRMDYLIDEIASIPQAKRPYLVMLGQIDEASPPIVEQARRKLDGDCCIRSVPYAEVSKYYSIADAFTLASIREGFGRVFLEALVHGLPCVVNDHPVMRYVLGEEGTFADLTQPGALAAAVVSTLARPLDQAEMARRRQYVRWKFGWDALRPQYFQLFLDCMKHEVTL
jgi:1,2-diacylglycerol 3-alpha-glucosyltransferase